MCLAIPGKVKKVDGRRVLVRYPGEEREVLSGGETVKIGDFVLVQMGVIIKILSSSEAKVVLKVWKGAKLDL